MKNNSHTTILSIVFGFLIINLFLEFKYITYILIFVSGISLFSENFSLFIDKIWFGLAKILSLIVPNILLSVVFYCILTPLSFLSKIFKSNSDFKLKNQNDSNFYFKNKSFSKKSFEKPY